MKEIRIGILAGVLTAVLFWVIFLQFRPSFITGEFEGGEVAKAAREEFCRKYLTPDEPESWRLKRCPDGVGE